MTISPAIAPRRRFFDLRTILAGRRAQRVPANCRIVIAVDDQHAPQFRKGDQLIVDTSRRVPEAGQFFAVEIQRFEDGEAHSMISIHRNEVVARQEGEPGRQLATWLAGFVAGVVIGTLRD